MILSMWAKDSGMMVKLRGDYGANADWNDLYNRVHKILQVYLPKKLEIDLEAVTYLDVGCFVGVLLRLFGDMHAYDARTTIKLLNVSKYLVRSLRLSGVERIADIQAQDSTNATVAKENNVTTESHVVGEMSYTDATGVSINLVSISMNESSKLMVITINGKIPSHISCLELHNTIDKIESVYKPENITFDFREQSEFPKIEMFNLIYSCYKTINLNSDGRGIKKVLILVPELQIVEKLTEIERFAEIANVQTVDDVSVADTDAVTSENAVMSDKDMHSDIVGITEKESTTEKVESVSKRNVAKSDNLIENHLITIDFDETSYILFVKLYGQLDKHGKWLEINTVFNDACVRYRPVKVVLDINDVTAWDEWEAKCFIYGCYKEALLHVEGFKSEKVLVYTKDRDLAPLNEMTAYVTIMRNCKVIDKSVSCKFVQFSWDFITRTLFVKLRGILSFDSDWAKIKYAFERECKILRYEHIVLDITDVVNWDGSSAGNFMEDCHEVLRKNTNSLNVHVIVKAIEENEHLLCPEMDNIANVIYTDSEKTDEELFATLNADDRKAVRAFMEELLRKEGKV